MADYLEIQSTSFPEQKEHFNSILDSYTKKLWHQLGNKLAEIIQIPFFQSDDHLLRLHDNIVKKIANNLNQQQYVWFALAVAKQQKDTETSLKFLEEIGEAVKEDKHASLLCKVEVARVRVQAGELATAKELLTEGKNLVQKYSGIVDQLVQSHLYLGLMEYYKVKGPVSLYYENSLLYMTYTPLESIPTDQQLSLASEVSLAAIVGDGIYNFGELLQHAVITKLHGTPKQWLSELLVAFNQGDIPTFKAIFAAQSGTEATLKAAEGFLAQKIRIMALIELVFARDAHSRNLRFDEIAATCDCELDRVELLLMKAFSLGVLTGVMDQVEQTVRIKWVQPRVLDLKQVGTIRDRLKDWSTQVADSARYLEANAPELLLSRG